MKTDSAARLYSQQFLRIVQLQKLNAALPLRVVRRELHSINPPIANPSTNPLYWDERWFANYE